MNIKVGNTPLIKIKYIYNNKENYIYTKLESYNLTGSIKDRVAYYMIKEAYKSGELKEGMEIVEATSGNTGIALAAMGSYFGNPVHIFMPDWVSVERLNLMKMYNAKVTLVSKEEGGFQAAINMAKEYAKKNNAYLTNQFENPNNVLAHYETTGEEIGVAKRLKEFKSDIKIYALEPDKMPLLSEGKILGDHKIEGIGDDFIPKIVDKDLIDEVITINDDDAVNMARKVALQLGLGVGISSGANLIASILKNENSSKPIVTVFADDNKKYLSTTLSAPPDNNEKFISNQIKILDYEFVNQQTQNY